MKKILISFMVCEMFFWAMVGIQLTGATQKFTTKTQAVAQMRAIVTQFAEVRKSTKGLALVNASQFSGEMVAMVINSGSEAQIEFASNGLMNTGTTPWPNVSVTATFEITAKSPNADMVYRASCEEMGSELSPGTSVKKNNTGQATVTSGLFSMAPNKEYRGVVRFILSATNDDGNWVRVKVTSIKFNL